MEIDLENLKKKQLLKILAVILLSEGYMNTTKSSPYIKLETLSSSKKQHLFLKDYA
jgi:hypothetical protein